MTGKPFTILVVCTGNVCRSPLADQMLADAVQKHLPADVAANVVVGSAGTEAPVGAPMSAPAAAISAKQGLDPAGHQARQLTIDLLREADLTLVATRQHRQDVARMLPRSARTLFTIREFGRGAEALLAEPREPVTSADDLRAVVSKMAGRRGYLPLQEPALDDIIDPIGRSERTYKRMADELIPAIESASKLLFQ